MRQIPRVTVDVEPFHSVEGFVELRIRVSSSRGPELHYVQSYPYDVFRADFDFVMKAVTWKIHEFYATESP